MNPKLKAWIKQPTTIIGIGLILGVGAGIACYYATRNADAAKAVAGSMFGVVCMALGDNTADKSSVEQLASDAIAAIVSQRVGAMIPTLGADVVRVFQTQAPAVVVTQPAPPATVVVQTPPAAVMPPAQVAVAAAPIVQTPV